MTAALTAMASMPSVASVLSSISARMEQLDPVPEPADVNAGTLGLVVLLGLVAGVVVLVILMSRQLKRVNRNAEQGAYDDLPGARRRKRLEDDEER